MSVGGQPVAVEHRATNIFRREQGRKLIHHHTDPAPALQAAQKQD
jgi:ketosteroid isomerase-like protein